MIREYKEVKKLNKLSKKVVSAVTTAAFTMTLVPFAAFAAVPAPAESDFVVSEVNAAGQMSVTVNLDESKDTPATTLENTKVKISVTNASGATVSGGEATDVAALAKDGVAQENASETYTFSGLSAGNHSVAVEVMPDSAAEDAEFVSIPSDDNTAYVSQTPSVGASQLLTSSDEQAMNNKSSVTVDPQDTMNIKFNVLDAQSNSSLLALCDGSTQAAYLWVLNSNGEFTDAITFAKADDVANVDELTPDATDSKYVQKIDESVTAGDIVKAIANRPGTYTICAGIGNPSQVDDAINKNPNTPSAALAQVDKLGGQVKVTVDPYTYETAEFDLKGDAADGSMTSDKTNTFVYDITDGITPNGIKVYTVTGKATQEDGTAAQYEVLNLKSNKSGLKLLDNEVGTDADGNFSFRFTISKADSYTVTIEEDNKDAKATLTVDASATIPDQIKTVKDDGTLLAGNDTNYTTDFEASDFFAKEVQFAITDIYGNAVSGADAIANQGAHTGDADQIRVDAPKGSDLTAGEMKLVWDENNGVYTVQYEDLDGTGADKDLIPGEYTVVVGLNGSSKTATAHFTLAKFGTVQDVDLDITAVDQNGQTAQNNSIEVIDDEVALGQTVTVRAYYVDENGIRVPAPATDDLIWGINGEAVATRSLGSYNPVTFTTATNNGANDGYVGTTITVKVFDGSANKYEERELTVVKAYLAETLEFDSTEGPADKDNTVAVSVVDENGKISKVNGTIHAYVADKSNADANVTVSVAKNVNDGKGALTVTSDAETTADIVVVVAATNGELYGKTLEYTFGEANINADTSVVMTIGSTDYVVNNQLVTGDAAPYVDSNWRTMVPFRVLGETFGAKVFWDNDARTVTYELGDTEIVMTIDSETYTVNGTEKTMDTAPVIGDGDRTYVPVRFVGEALGYTVTALQDANNLTAGVVFQK